MWLSVIGAEIGDFASTLKYISRLTSPSIRIILTRVISSGLIDEDREKVEMMLSWLAKAMKAPDYLTLKKNTLSTYPYGKYDELFGEIEENFGLIAKRKLALAEKNGK